MVAVLGSLPLRGSVRRATPRGERTEAPSLSNATNATSKQSVVSNMMAAISQQLRGGARARGGQLGTLITASKQRGKKKIIPARRFSTTAAAPPAQQNHRFSYASYRNPNFALGVGGGLLLAGFTAPPGRRMISTTIGSSLIRIQMTSHRSMEGRS